MKSDQELQADVLAELKCDPRVHSNEIGVLAKDGAVTLTGVVQSYAEKVAVEGAAKRVKGVRAIAEHIKVKLPDEPRAGDDGIAERIAHLITWTSMLRNTNVVAEVRRGNVTLTGEVDYPYQKQLAASRVAELNGPISISNNIKLREAPAEVHARDVVRQITRALHRHANIEASNIHVSVANGKVKLEGTIPTYPERALVEEAAWSAGGVKAIENHLRVG